MLINVNKIYILLIINNFIHIINRTYTLYILLLYIYIYYIVSLIKFLV